MKVRGHPIIARKSFAQKNTFIVGAGAIISKTSAAGLNGKLIVT